MSILEQPGMLENGDGSIERNNTQAGLTVRIDV